MSYYETILNTFLPDEPILIEDIENLFPNKSRSWIDKLIKSMVDEKMIKRFSTGVYYIPRQTIFGDSVLSTNKVISKSIYQTMMRSMGMFQGCHYLTP